MQKQEKIPKHIECDPYKLIRAVTKAGACEDCGIISVTWFFDNQKKPHWLCEACAEKHNIPPVFKIKHKREVIL